MAELAPRDATGHGQTLAQHRFPVVLAIDFPFHARPPISEEMQELIRTLSHENYLWSAARIRDALILLQYDPPGEDTIRKDMVKPNKPRERSTI